MILSRAIRASASIPAQGQWIQLEDLFHSSEELAPSQRQAEQLSPIAAAHRILTNGYGLIPFGVYERKDGARVPVENEALNRVLKGRPNPNYTRFVLQKTQMSNAFWYGWGAIWNVRDSNGRVVERYALPSDCGSIRQDRETGAYWYDFNVDGVQKTFSSYDLSILFFETYDGIHGRGMLELARAMTAADSKAQDYQAKFYANGARLSGIVEVDTDADKDTRDKIRKAFSRFAGEDAFKVAVLDHNMKFTPLGLSHAEAQYVEGRSFTVEEVARFTGIPKYMLQTGKEAYNSNQQQRIDYVCDTLVPFITQAEQEDTYKLIPKLPTTAGWYIKGNPAALMRGDDESRSQFYEKMIFCGVYNVDDARQLEEKPPIPDGLGQVHFITKNLASLESVAKGETT